MEISKGERESLRKGGERRSPSSPLSWYTASESCYLARIWRGLALLAELDTVKARDRQVKGYFSLLPVLLISGRKKEGMIIYGTKVLEDISSIFFESFPPRACLKRNRKKNTHSEACWEAKWPNSFSPPSSFHFSFLLGFVLRPFSAIPTFSLFFIPLRFFSLLLAAFQGKIPFPLLSRLFARPTLGEGIEKKKGKRERVVE